MVSPSQGHRVIGENGDICRSQHDEIMIWLDGMVRKHPEEICGPITTFDEGGFLARKAIAHWEKNSREKYPSSGNRYLNSYIDTKFEEIDRSVKIEFCEWEKPIGNIGFADLYVVFARPFIDCAFSGTIDDIVCKKFTSVSKQSVAFEVKTDKASLGETIRQIKAYGKAYNHNNKDDAPDMWCVCAPPLKDWRRILVSQGISFLAYHPVTE